MNGAVENSENLAPFFSYSLDDASVNTLKEDSY
jgi:hypothetical protein